MKYLLEIALLTKDRPEMVVDWIMHFGTEIIEHNDYILSIHDSSVDNKTEKVLRDYLPSCSNYKYVHYPEDIVIDIKAIDAYKNSEADYILPIGDQRYFSKITIEKIDRVLRNSKCDVICFTGTGQKDKTVKYPTDLLLHYWNHITLLGAVIYKSTIFTRLKNNELYTYYTSKFNRNDAFSPQGIFFSEIAGSTISALIFGDEVLRLNRSKKRAWMSRFLDVWCDNFIYVIDNLPGQYDAVKDDTLKNSWKMQNWTKWRTLIRARLDNGINSVTYEKYENELYRVTDKVQRIKIMAYTPLWLVRFISFPYITYVKLRDLIKNILSDAKQRRGILI